MVSVGRWLWFEFFETLGCKKLVDKKIDRQAGHVHPKGQHRARQRVGLQLMGVSVVPGAGEVQGFKVFSTKTDHRGALQWHGVLSQQVAVGGKLANASAFKQRDPIVALHVHGSTIGATPIKTVIYQAGI
jgi:hypothetical protein